MLVHLHRSMRFYDVCVCVCLLRLFSTYDGLMYLMMSFSSHFLCTFQTTTSRSDNEQNLQVCVDYTTFAITKHQGSVLSMRSKRNSIDLLIGQDDKNNAMTRDDSAHINGCTSTLCIRQLMRQRVHVHTVA
jgi:hypothetical protein